MAGVALACVCGFAVCVAGLGGAKDMRRAAASAAGGARGVAAAAGEAPGAGRCNEATSAVRRSGVGTVEGDLPAVRVADQSKRFLDTRAGFFAEFVSVAAASRFLPRCWPANGKDSGREDSGVSAKSTRSSKEATGRSRTVREFPFRAAERHARNGHDDTVSLGARSPRPVRAQVLLAPPICVVLLGTADFKILKLTPDAATRRLAAAVRLGSSSCSSSSELQRHTRARSRAPAARARVATHMGVAERRRSSAAASTRDRSDASRADADGDENDPALPWRRILYERQGYPDNHTDDSFLERLVLNGRVVPRRFTRVALDATAVSQQLAVVALKASATASLLSGRLSARDALACDAAALAAGALVAIRAAQTDGAAIAAAIGASARLGALMLLALGALTPLFQTMTAAVSDDTAFATAACASSSPR